MLPRWYRLRGRGYRKLYRGENSRARHRHSHSCTRCPGRQELSNCAPARRELTYHDRAIELRDSAGVAKRLSVLKGFIQS